MTPHHIHARLAYARHSIADGHSPYVALLDLYRTIQGHRTMTPPNQYERENAIDAIDGYWSPDPHFTEANARKAFEAAKEENRRHRLRDLECIEAITFEQFLYARPLIERRLKEYAQLPKSP